MAFRYMNIGDGVGIIPSAQLNVIEDAAFSKTGKAFSTNLTSGTCYLFTLPGYIGSDLWIMFDLYVNATSSGNFRLGYWTMADTYSKKNLAWINGCYIYGKSLRLAVDASTITSFTLPMKTLNRIWIHLHNEDGSDKSYGEITFGGETKIQTYTRNTDHIPIGAEVDALKTIALYFSDNDNFISNLIIADEYISPREQVVALPISATDTDMTAGENGLYIADTANLTLLQSVDAAALGELHGDNSQVTGISLVGNPAYKTAEDSASLTSLSKSGGVVTEHDSFSLSDDTASVIQSSRALSNTTIADLQNMQFGWKAGA